MKKFAKIAAIVVAVVLVAALLAPALFRKKIERIVKREANEMLAAQLDFDRLSISLLRHFPNASVDLKGLTLIGAEPFAGDTVVAAKRISVVVDLMSLLGDGGLVVRKIVVADPAVHARKLPDGRVNWDVMKPADEAPAAAAAQSDDASAAFRLSVRDFRLTDAVIRYEDDSTGMRFSTGPASLRLRGDLSAAETDLALRLSAERMRLLSGGVPLLSDAEAQFDAVIAADLAQKRFVFSDNRLRLNAVELTLDGWVELLDEGLKMDVEAGSNRVQFKDVLSLVPAFYTREFRNLKAGGELSLDVWARGEMRGAQLPAFELKAEVRDGSFQYASLPKAVTGINIAARVANPGGAMDKTEVDLSKFTFQMAGNSLSAALYATNLASDPLFRGSAAGRVDLGAVRDVYPLEKGTKLGGQIAADVKLSGRMSDVDENRYDRLGAAGTFVVEGLSLTLSDLPEVHIRRAAATITPEAMTLGDFGATIGRSDLSANGQLTDYLGYLLRGERLSGRLYVKSDLLDLNQILDAMPASDASDTSAAGESAAPGKAFEVPRNLNLTLVTELHKILFQKMNITDLTGEMGIDGGVLALRKLRMQLFGGSVAASGSYSTAADPARPELKLSAQIAGASFRKTFEELDMVQKLVPLFAKTGGDYSLSLDLSTPLDAQMSPVLQALNASGELRSENIRVQNIEAFDKLASALGNDALRRIEAKDVAIRFTIRDGRIATQPFDLTLGGLKLNLSGSTGLDQSIDYTARVTLPVAAGGVLETLNVGIGGTFSDPKITLGVREAAEEAVKQIIDRKIEELTGSASLSDEVQKQAERLRAEARQAGGKLVEAARAQRDKLVEGASSKGPLAKLAAEKAGDKLVEEAEKQAARLVEEADRQIDKLTAGKE